MQQPSPGRIVLYCFRDRRKEALVERPAIITSVEAETVKLTVFFELGDSDQTTRGHSGDPGFDSRYEMVPENKSDQPMSNMWRWPPRV
jgi:hypothetical protein